jgi:hypothetical protein
MPNKVKKKFKDTKVGGFLSNIAPDLFKTGLSLASGFLPDGGLLATLAGKIKSSSELDAEQKAEGLALLTLDVQDRADARAMNTAIATSEHSTKLAKNFIYYLSIGLMVFSFVVVIMLFLIEIPDKNRDVINFILGILVGTGLTGIFNYFYGSSQGDQDKFKHLTNKN